VTLREKELEKGGEIPVKFTQRTTEQVNSCDEISVQQCKDHNLSNLVEFFKQKHL